MTPPLKTTATAWSRSHDGSNFANALECPVLSLPLHDAVLLTPCGHTISEVAAKNIYGVMRSIVSVEHRGPCPLCRERVRTYYPNQTVRALVTALGTQHLEDALPLISPIIMADPVPDLASIPFSQKGANLP